MGTTKIKVTRTARKKDGSSQGTIKTSTKTTVSPQKVTTRQSRSVTRKGISVSYVKGS